MSSRERAAIIERLHKLADEALVRAKNTKGKAVNPAVASKEIGRAEAYRLAADLIEKGIRDEDV